MRPFMLETGLESISYNLNRKNSSLQLFEFGKTYSNEAVGKYTETDHLCLYVTGNVGEDSWKRKANTADLYYMKGVINNLFKLLGLKSTSWDTVANPKLEVALEVRCGEDPICQLGMVHTNELKQFDIRQPVLYADLNWELLLNLVRKNELKASELPKQLPVYRDLAMIVPSTLPYGEVEKTVKTVRLDKLQEIKLFDIFESEKLGKDRKSLAVSFTFLDAEKTLTDIEIDAMMNTIMKALEKQLSAEIRK
jgi:phenylalanyl-tRNA synthetase beta chain